jgi:hypothetical protein
LCFDFRHFAKLKNVSGNRSANEGQKEKELIIYGSLFSTVDLPL